MKCTRHALDFATFRYNLRVVTGKCRVFRVDLDHAIAQEFVYRLAGGLEQLWGESFHAPYMHYPW